MAFMHVACRLVVDMAGSSKALCMVVKSETRSTCSTASKAACSLSAAVDKVPQATAVASRNGHVLTITGRCCGRVNAKLTRQSRQQAMPRIIKAGKFAEVSPACERPLAPKPRLRAEACEASKQHAQLPKTITVVTPSKSLKRKALILAERHFAAYNRWPSRRSALLCVFKKLQRAFAFLRCTQSPLQAAPHWATYAQDLAAFASCESDGRLLSFISGSYPCLSWTALIYCVCYRR